MIIYGTDVLIDRGTGKVAWDFVDGPLDTEDADLIAEAKRLGFFDNPPMPLLATEQIQRKKRKS